MAARFQRGALLLAALVALLLPAAAWVFSGILLYPDPFPCTKKEEQELYVFCGTPADRGVSFEAVELRTSDGLRLRAWYIPVVRSERVVVIGHGRHAGKWTALRYVPALHQAGLNVLAFDFRNHGESQGAVTTTGYLERRDVRAAVDYAIRRGNRRVGYYGFSMGAATGILAMAEDPRIEAAIFESPFADFGQLIAEAGGAQYGLPRFPLIPLVLALFEWRSGANVRDMRPLSVVGRLSPRPVFFIHGTDDPVIGIHHARELFEASGQPKRFWEVPGGRHVNSWNVDRIRAEREVSEFFRAALR